MRKRRFVVVITIAMIVISMVTPAMSAIAPEKIVFNVSIVDKEVKKEKTTIIICGCTKAQRAKG